MFKPEDPLAPLDPVFAEPWHAQALALADALVRSGSVSAAQWAEALGIALRQAEAGGAPDTTDTYYTAVIAALEAVGETHVGIDSRTRSERRAAWEQAYLVTPHGKPVVLETVDSGS